MYLSQYFSDVLLLMYVFPYYYSALMALHCITCGYCACRCCAHDNDVIGPFTGYGASQLSTPVDYKYGSTASFTKGQIFRILTSWNHANSRVAVCRDDSLSSQGLSSPLYNSFEFSAITGFSWEDRASRLVLTG